MDEKQRYTVEISGMELNLLSDESEEYVLELAKIIDQRINSMVMSSKRCSKTEAALVCALDSLDEKVKMQLKYSTIKTQRDEVLRENQLLKKELEEFKTAKLK